MTRLVTLIAALMFSAVTLIGPVAVTCTLTGRVYMGGTLGLLALPMGMWWLYVANGPVAYVGLFSSVMGFWSALQAFKHDLAQ